MKLRNVLSMVLILILFSCQKGEEDPVFSVVTRKSRITGDWLVKNSVRTSSDVTSTYADNIIEYNYGDSLIVSREMDWNLSFQRDGIYVVTQIEYVPEDTLLGDKAYTLSYTETGKWEFTGGNNSPSKSQLLLMKTESKTTRSDQGSNIVMHTFDGPNSGIVFDIIRLSSSDLKLAYDETISFGGGQLIEQAEIKLVKE